MNELIVQKIKNLRMERGLTQKDLADHLGRTAAAISDLERGKVQVTASDLFILSELLGKPIEFFFGASKYQDDIEDVVTIMQNMDAETREMQIPIIKSLLILQIQTKQIEQVTDISQDELKEHAAILYQHLMTYLHGVRELYTTGLDAKAKLEEVLGTGKIENRLTSIE